MKVLFQSRVDLLEKKGGDTIQVVKTADELRKLGVEVVLNCGLNVDVSGYDLVHVFQLDWIAETYSLVTNAKKYNKPVILSPIHHSEVEVVEYELHERYTLRRLTNAFVQSQETLDVLKNVYRSFSDTRRFQPTLSSILNGYRKQQISALNMSDAVLTQTQAEGDALKEDFGYTKPFTVIKLGVSQEFLDYEDTKYFDFDNYVLTVGRVEPRKNQLKIIQAVNELNKELEVPLKLVVVGSLNKNNVEYYLKFKYLLKKMPFVVHVPQVKYELMPGVYKGACVCVSASYFETTGLTLIEAALSGTNVVVRNGHTGKVLSEYLGDLPTQCVPYDVTSIKEAIKVSLTKKRPELSLDLRTTYTWSNVAKETLKVYNGILNGI